MKKNVALVGVSGYGAVHLRNLVKLVEKGVINLVAAVIINPDDVAEAIATLKEKNCKIFSSTSEMYQECSQIDLVCLPVGIPMHRILTEEALAHGCNVFVEKPVASSMEDIQSMSRAAESSDGKFIAIGFQNIYETGSQKLKQLLLDGAIGKIKSISAVAIGGRPDQYYSRNNWAGKLKSANGVFILDSPANNAFAHHLNLELFFAGETFESSASVKSVEAELYRARPEIENFDTCAFRTKTESGIDILTLFSHASDQNLGQFIKVEGEKGVANWQQTGIFQIVSNSGETIYEYNTAEELLEKMFGDVIKRLTDDNQFVCTLDIAAKQTEVIEKLYKEATIVDLTTNVTRAEGNGQYIIKDLYEIFEKCYAENRLPKELNIELS